MFKEKNQSVPEKVFTNSATLISAGSVLKGDIKSENDLRIDGTINGNVICTAKVVIGPSGLIEGNISANGADVTGKVIGNIVVKELLQLRGQSNVNGNINAGKLQVDPTAIFNGKCQMGAQAASVVQMTEPELDVTAKAK